MKKWPTVDFVTPTLNEEANIETCLKSIVRQDYPKSKIKIYVIDGGSSDNTVKLARKYGAVIINNPEVESDSGKYLALKRSKAEFVCLLDADNELIGKNWLKKMISPLMLDSDIFGMESEYFSRKKWGYINEYLMALHIGDPMARAFAAKLEITNKDGYIEHIVPKGDAYPVGADGFIWRRSVIDDIGLGSSGKFAEANFSFKAYQKGYSKFGRVKNTGIYHKYVMNVGKFVRKRKRIAKKNLVRMGSGQNTWVYSRNRFRLVTATLYCLSIIGPIIESTREYSKSGKISWFLHPVFCFISASVYLYYYTIYLIKLQLGHKMDFDLS